MAAESRKPGSSGLLTGATPDAPARSRPVVLVVDDDARILRVVSMGLRVAGYDVATASGGQEALALLGSVKLDVVLLDLMMSPVDGFEVLRRLRASSNLPVIVMSAHTSAAPQALSLGANAFVSKPFGPAQVDRQIRAVLSRRV